MAEIIDLAAARQAKVSHIGTPSEEEQRLLTFALLNQIGKNLGLPPDYKGKFVVTRREAPETPLAILERIATRMGIPLEDEEPSQTAPKPRRPRR